MKSLRLLLTATMAVALSATAFAKTSRDRTQVDQSREVQSKNVTRDRDGQQVTTSQDRSDRSRSQASDQYDQRTQGADRQSVDRSRPGLRELEQLGSARIMFYRLGPADMRISKLIGLEIRNLQDQEIGEIEDIILENGKTMRAVVVAVGGFLGMGERYVAVDPASIVISRNEDGDVEAVLNTTRDDLRNAPEFRFDDRRQRVGRVD